MAEKMLAENRQAPLATNGGTNNSLGGFGERSSQFWSPVFFGVHLYFDWMHSIISGRDVSVLRVKYSKFSCAPKRRGRKERQGDASHSGAGEASCDHPMNSNPPGGGT